MNAYPAGPEAPARGWRALADGRVVCETCPHHCRLEPDQAGRCGVRVNRAGRLVLTVYGRTSGLCVDPIEKKPLYHFLPGTAVLSLGTVGCNLRCRFCQNWTISQADALGARLEPAAPEAVAAAAGELGCRSVAFTYNEPAIFWEYAVDTARACRARGLRTVAVTAGYLEGGARTEFFADLDAANVDLKSLRDDFYRRWCGARLAPVLDTLRYVRRETNVWLEVTTLLIPGANDTDDELRELAAWVAAELGPETPLHFSAFRPEFRLRDRPATPPATLRRARALAQACGLRHVYLGNVFDAAGSATHCAGCGRRVIAREGFAVTGWDLAAGRCRFCGAPCAGVFEAEPGRWGSRCQPVRLAGG